MSNRSKGQQYEREFEEFLKEKGYTVERVKGSTKWNKSVDFFGVWDIISFNKTSWLLAQVKTTYRKKVKEQLLEWVEKTSPPQNTICIYAVRRKNKKKKERWRMINILGEFL